MITCVAPLAQLAEKLTLNQRVDGSSPSGGILENKPLEPNRSKGFFRVLDQAENNFPFSNQLTGANAKTG